MWLVSRGAKNAKGVEPIAAALSDTLRIWYTGRGNHRDEEAALMLVRHARKNGKWIACGCRGKNKPPMLSPALLTGADTYYLRRLTAKTRPEHDISCPFFKEQTFTTTTSDRRPARNPPEGFFSVLRPPAISLAQHPEEEPAPRDAASHGAPRLAKLLWRLLEMSGRTTIHPIEDERRDIASEFAAVKALAEHLEVAPEIPLARVLFTHPRDWESLRVFAVLRELSKSWPRGHEPQAYLLVFAKRIHEQSIETSDGVIDLATRLRHPGTRAKPIKGPDLTLVAVGQDPDIRGYGALRAWGQPVHNGHRFIPVDEDFDRDIIETLIKIRPVLERQKTAMTVKKPLFDYITPDGPVRPAWHIILKKGQKEIPIVLETTGPEYHEPQRERALSFIGTILHLDETNLSEFPRELVTMVDKIPES